MRKLFTLVALVGLGLSSIGCEGKPAAPPATKNEPAPPAADKATTGDAAAPAEPAPSEEKK
jgi:hypothetical protein